jgi:hypothetical protein
MSARGKKNPGLPYASADRPCLAIVVLLAALVASFMAIVAVHLNRNFLISAADTSVFHNTLVNLLQGRGFRVTAYSGPNLLGQHTMFILLAIAPLYAAIPSVETLFTLQAWVVFSSVVPLYLIARRLLQSSRSAFFIALLALTCPLFFQMALAPFHPESGILPGVLWSYYFYLKNRMMGFWICFLLAVSCAEQAAMIYVALGLALFCANDGLAWRERYSKFALIGGALWLILGMGLLIPIMSRPGQLNVMHYHYSQWGVESASDLLGAVARDPVRAFQYLFSPSRWFYLAGLVGVPLLLIFTNPRLIVLLLPFPFYFLASDHEFFLNFHAYYFQFAFFAGYLGLISFLAKRPVSKWPGKTILALAFAMNVLALGPIAHDFSALAKSGEDPLNQSLRALFAKLPQDSGVYCPTRYCAYLSNHANIVVGDLREENLDLDARLAEEQDFTDVRPDQIDYIVCDVVNDQCGLRQNGFNPDFAKNRADNLKRYTSNGPWQVFWQQDDVVILHRAGNG